MTNYLAYPGLDVYDRKKVAQESWMERCGAKDATEFIIHVVAKAFDINSQDMLSASRKRIYMEPRCIAIHHIKRRTTLSLTDIGKIFGGRDHSTVIYNLSRYDNLYVVDKPFKKIASKIEKLL